MTRGSLNGTTVYTVGDGGEAPAMCFVAKGALRSPGPRVILAPAMEVLGPTPRSALPCGT